MESSQFALLAIIQRSVYDLKLNSYAWVNKIICLEDELVIAGYTMQYRVFDYGKTWRLSENEKYEEAYTLSHNFEEWLAKTIKLQKSNEF